MKIRVSLTQQELQHLAADYIARKTGLTIGQVEEFTLEYHEDTAPPYGQRVGAVLEIELVDAGSGVNPSDPTLEGAG